MPIRDYGVLKGVVVQTRSESAGKSPHFQIRVRSGSTEARVAVNVLSQQSPSELLYLADEAFDHPVLTGLPNLPDGFTALESQPGGAALDFVRGHLFERSAMHPVPSTAPGPDNDLADLLQHYLSRASADPDGRVYAFGSRWGPEPSVPDLVFGFTPGNGVHDIHFNQGNVGQFVSDDGVWQDGALLLQLPREQQWVAIFLAFQSQVWDTDDETGHANPPKVA